MRRGRFSWCVVVCASQLWLSGCSNGSAEVPCGEIPAAGCPAKTGGTCGDPSCTAIYSCTAGDWLLKETCTAGTGAGGTGVGGDAQGGGGAGGGAQGGNGGEGGCQGVVIDKSGQTAGCAPDLQPPDCGVAAAEACLPCQGGCLDFFMCKAEGWVSVAFCDQNGDFFVEE